MVFPGFISGCGSDVFRTTDFLIDAYRRIKLCTFYSNHSSNPEPIDKKQSLALTRLRFLASHLSMRLP